MKIRCVSSGRGHRRAVFLIELIGYLVILAAVAVLVTDLVVLLMRSTRETNRRDTMIARVDAAIDLLRRDAWDARGFRVVGNTVEIDDAAGKVVWNASPDGLSRTLAGAPARTFVEMPRVTFAAGERPGVLLVSVDAGPGGKATHEELTLTSQRLLAGVAR